MEVDENWLITLHNIFIEMFTGADIVGKRTHFEGGD